MIDVFFTTCAKAADPIRYHLMLACFERWQQEGGIDLHGVHVNELGCSLKAFQGARRTFADDHAKSDVYLCVDDDCMPLGLDFVKRGLQIFEKYPEYAVMAARLLPESPEVYERIRRVDAMWPDTIPAVRDSGEMIDGEAARLTSGGINFCRKGPLGPILPRNGEFFDDSHMTQGLKQAGWKVGIARDLYTNHLGASLSTLWPTDYAGNGTEINPFSL